MEISDRAGRRSAGCAAGCERGQYQEAGVEEAFEEEGANEEIKAAEPEERA